MARVHRIETPQLRVSRPVSACQRCRSAKVKCDGLLPACGACSRAGRAAECSSANDHFAKGKERSYVASLESRIEKLEKQIAQAKTQQASTSNLGTGAVQPLLSNERHVSVGSDKKIQRKEATDVDDLVGDFGFL